ncbi:glycosyltransferase family 4 protein [Natrinema sp. 74]|uniref:glycosyltransferase family 4 protein n=1 Tax=Natrinema sp. 74 TaxID=3384159 RepID=UPI0038D4C382
MRICLLSDGYPPWERGGAQRIAAQLAEGYAERGHETHVVTTVPDRGETGRSVADGVVVHRLWTPRCRAVLPYLTLRNPLIERALPDVLVDVAPDIVHAHNVHYLSNASLRIADEHGLPIVKTFHDAGTVSYGELTTVAERAPVDIRPGPAETETETAGDPSAQPEALAIDGGASASADPVSVSESDTGANALPAAAYRVSPVQQAIEQGARYLPARTEMNRRCLAARVDVGVAVSEALRRGLAVNGVECERVIHNGIDASRFERPDPDAPSEAAFRRRHGLEDAPFVLFGGRTSDEKGGAYLAAAFERLVDDGVDARLLVTGDDGYVERMRAVAGPAADRIVSPGWLPRPALRTAFRSARVVASPSVHLDPFPTVNLEAFAAGTPVVTTAFGGASELVDDGVNGRVVDPRNVSALADALESFLVGPERATAFGTAGRETVRDRFTVAEQVAVSLDLLEAVWTGDRPPD